MKKQRIVTFLAFIFLFVFIQLVYYDLIAAEVPDDDSDESWNVKFKMGFDRVSKWTNNINIFDKKKLFIPVNHNSHWSMVVVCNPGSSISVVT
jgi:Ulp1 family protease